MNEHGAPTPQESVPDNARLFGLVVAECNVAVKAMNALSAFLDTGGKEAAEMVRSLEREANRIRTEGFAALRAEFASSPLREDVYRAINRMHEIAHYAATSIREMEVLRAVPDKYLQAMAVHLRTGTLSLQAGFAKLAEGITDVSAEVEEARESERNTEEGYRQALSKLFDPSAFIEKLDTWEHRAHAQFLGHYLRKGEEHRHGAAATALAYVVDIFRRREILRHLSNAADRVLYASDILDETAADAAWKKG